MYRLRKDLSPEYLRILLIFLGIDPGLFHFHLCICRRILSGVRWSLSKCCETLVIIVEFASFLTDVIQRLPKKYYNII